VYSRAIGRLGDEYGWHVESRGSILERKKWRAVCNEEESRKYRYRPVFGFRYVLLEEHKRAAGRKSDDV
jgi:hypothetical protein